MRKYLPLLVVVGILLVIVVVFFLLTPSGSAADNPVVIMETSMGTIKIELYPERAPETVKNFLQYVDEKHYDGTIFHRVTNSPPVIQGGGYAPGFIERKTRPAIRNEATNGLSNERGTIAMARTEHPHSATDQFYINVQDNPFLDHNARKREAGYCVFGKVIEGMEVADSISKVATGTHKGRDVPKEDVLIKSVRRAEK